MKEMSAVDILQTVKGIELLFPIKMVCMPCQDVTRLAAIGKCKVVKVLQDTYSLPGLGETKKKLCNDQELMQSKLNSCPRNLNWKQPKLKIDITKGTYG